MSIIIEPDRIDYLRLDRAKTFCVVTTPALKSKLSIATSTHYEKVMIATIATDQPIDDFLAQQSATNTDYFFLPYGYTIPNLTASKEYLAKDCKFLALRCLPTTPIDIDDIHYFLKNIMNTSPEMYIAKADTFFSAIENRDKIIYADNNHKTQATLTVDNSCLWGEAYGDLRAGESGVIPCGEIALTHVNFKDNKPHPLPLNGEIVLQGLPIIHHYNLTSAAAIAKQAALYNALTVLQQAPVIATVTNGVITTLTALDKKAEPAIDALENLFNENKYYRTIIEVGHGLNHTAKLAKKNCSMNESFGGNDYCIHYGLGHMRFSDFHVDVICQNTRIV